MMISYDDFTKLDLRVAQILKAERVEGSEKLLRLEVSAGDKDDSGADVMRQMVAGIGKSYEPETLVGTQIVIVANLEPRKLMGIESNGMLLATRRPKEPEGEEIILLRPGSEAPPGSKIN